MEAWEHHDTPRHHPMIFNFHGNPNGQLNGYQGDIGYDVDTAPNNFFINNGGNGGGTVWTAFNVSGSPSGAWGGIIPTPPAPPCITSPIVIPGWGFGNPSAEQLVACGYDPTCYIRTAQLIPQPYVTQALIQAKLGGLIRLIESCDDSQPPSGNWNDLGVQAVYNAVIQTVTTEINGYLATIYPVPLAQTGTVSILQITSVSSDGTNYVTGISVIVPGNYQVAPAQIQNPAYMRYVDPLQKAQWLGDCEGDELIGGCGWNFQNFNCQNGTGLQLNVQYVGQNYSDESGQVLQAQAISGVPTILAGGANYQVGQLIVLVGGSSFVPGKVRQAALDLICHTFYKRRLAPDEKNPFSALGKMWRDLLVEISEGDKDLDGTYRRNFSPVASWNTRSVLFGANSL